MENTENTVVQESTQQAEQSKLPVTFTPDQLEEANRIAEERAQRASSAALKSYFQQQGMSEEEAKAALTAYKKQKETEKTPDQLIQEARQDADTRIAAAKQSLIQLAANAAATQLGIKAERVPYLLKMADLSAVEVDDHMTVDQEAVAAALQSVLEAVPELAGTTMNTMPSANPAAQTATNRGIDAIRHAAGLKTL